MPADTRNPTGKLNLKKLLLALLLLASLTISGIILGNPAFAADNTETSNQSPEIIVFRSPTCGCCKDWGDRMQEAGFTITEEHLRDDMATVKTALGIPAPMESCHTAIINGLLVEGHVPADAITQALQNRPEGVVGLAAPGMPIGSPGMEMGDRQDPYTIYAFTANGSAEAFREY